jgi:hypothetical protein
MGWEGGATHGGAQPRVERGEHGGAAHGGRRYLNGYGFVFITNENNYSNDGGRRGIRIASYGHAGARTPGI